MFSKIASKAPKVLAYAATAIGMHQTTNAINRFGQEPTADNFLNATACGVGLFSGSSASIIKFMEMGVKTGAFQHTVSTSNDLEDDFFNTQGFGGDPAIINEAAGNMFQEFKELDKKSIREDSRNIIRNLILEIANDPRISMTKFTRIITQAAGYGITFNDIISGIEELGIDIKEALEMYQNTPVSERKKGEEISIDESVCQEGDFFS